MINLIVARSRNNVIGNASGIPWKVPGEQKQFKELTTGNAVIMGRKTYEDIGHPLPNRLNIVVSNTKNFTGENLMTARSVKEAIDIAVAGDHAVYIAGGYSIYKEAIPYVDRMHITEIDIDVPVDESTVFFPEFDKGEFEFRKQTYGVGDGIKYVRTVYVRPESFKGTPQFTLRKTSVKLSELDKILDEAFTEVTEHIPSCVACTMESECDKAPVKNQVYCTARIYRQLVRNKIKGLEG